jgi:hypothetical protein
MQLRLLVNLCVIRTALDAIPFADISSRAEICHDAMAIHRAPSSAISGGTSCRPANSRNVTSYPIDRRRGTMTRLHWSIGRI